MFDVTISIDSKQNTTASSVVARMRCNEKEKWLHGLYTSNNRIQSELKAIAGLLEYLKAPCNVSIHTTNAKIVNAVESGEVKLWVSTGWKGVDPAEAMSWKLLIASARRNKHILKFEYAQSDAFDASENKWVKVEA